MDFNSRPNFDHARYFQLVPRRSVATVQNCDNRVFGEIDLGENVRGVRLLKYCRKELSESPRVAKDPLNPRPIVVRSKPTEESVRDQRSFPYRA